jgi:hypothetical protein
LASHPTGFRVYLPAMHELYDELAEGLLAAGRAEPGLQDRKICVMIEMSFLQKKKEVDL